MGGHIPLERVTTALGSPRLSRTGPHHWPGPRHRRPLTQRRRHVRGRLANPFWRKHHPLVANVRTAREDALQIMLRHAQELGANAIIAMRYDATEVANGVTEVLAYGTAVLVEITG